MGIHAQTMKFSYPTCYSTECLMFGASCFWGFSFPIYSNLKNEAMESSQ